MSTPLPRKKRDPRNKRDPRRRAVSVEQLEENPLSTENLNPGAKTEKPGDELKELEKVVEPKNLEVDWEDPVDKEDSIEKAKIEKLENLLVNLEEPEEIVATMEEEKIEKTENLLQILKALPLPIDPEMEEQQEEKEVVCINVESDSDDEKLQIDESFDDGGETTVLTDPGSNTYLANLQRSEQNLDEENNELWKKVYSISNSKIQPPKAFDTAKGRKTGTEEEEEESEVTIVAEMKKTQRGTAAEKSGDQLEVEKELLRKLVEEREMLKATLAEAGILREENFPTNFDEVEEGELADSYDNDDNENKEKVDSLFALGNPENPRTDGIDLTEPRENRFKKYWDDFPEDQGPKC